LADVKVNRGGTKYIDIDGLVTHKECTQCKVLKGVGCFGISNSQFARRQSKCKECRSEYYKNNKKYISKKQRIYEAENREEINRKRRDKRRQKKINNEQEIIKVFGSVDEFNKYLNEKDRLRTNKRNREWYKENSDSIKENKKKYRKENNYRIKKYANEYYEENKLSKLIYIHDKRAIENNVQTGLTEEQIARTFGHFGNRCCLTGDECEIDHVIPLSLGKAGNVVENILPLNKKLNSSKGNKNLFDWFFEVKDDLGLCETKFYKSVEYIAKLNNMTVSEYKRYVDSNY